MVSNVKHALEFYFPQFKDHLPRTSDALLGWRKAVPEHRLGVCPKECVFLVAHDLMIHGHLDAGIAVLLAFAGYLRTADVIGLRTGDLVLRDLTNPNLPNYGAIRIAQSMRGLNESLVIRPHFLCVLLQRLAERRRILGRRANPVLFGYAPVRWRTLIHESTARIGLGHLKITPHTFRYGGASHDILYGTMEPSGVQTRGRWNTEKSFRRYIQVSQLLANLELTPAQLRERARLLLAHPHKFFNVPSPGALGNGQVTLPLS